MARRQIARRNAEGDLPGWVWPAVAGFGALVVLSAIVGGIRKSNAPVYFYWAESRPGDFGEDWIPMIQQQGQATVFELPAHINETSALWAAEDEIESRGGKAQRGRPVA